MKLIKLVLLVASLLMVSRSGFADSILVGTDLSGVTGGAGLCPNGSDCELIAQQFALTESVVVDQVKVVLAGPYLLGNSNGNFTVSLAGISPIGSGDLAFNPNGNVVAQVFAFGNLDIPLGPGTYYLVVSGGNLTWPAGAPLITSAGSIGAERLCDPTIEPCDDNPGSMFWQPIDHPRGMEIDGNVVTPEPSSWLLFGTGLLGLCGIARRRWLSLSV